MMRTDPPSWPCRSRRSLPFLLLAGSLAASSAASRGYEVLYQSSNLSQHAIAPECNPGGGTECPCTEADVALSVFADHGEVTSNVQETHTWVNAIGHRKLIETIPSGDSIGLAVYRYAAEVRLPDLPFPDPDQIFNPQAVHLMIQLWDGRDALGPSLKHSLEGTIYWDLNPWTEDFGKVKVYTGSLDLVETGITLTPDLAWHSFVLEIDLVERRYREISVDGRIVTLDDIRLAEVEHLDWGEEVALTTTTESLAAWPGFDCGSIFRWTTWFREIEFGLEHDTPAAADDPPPQTLQPVSDLICAPLYPNSFSHSVQIPYRLPAPARVTLTILDVSGRRVRQIELGVKPAGLYTTPGRAVCWNGTDDRGRPAATGLYTFILRAGERQEIGRATLLR